MSRYMVVKWQGENVRFSAEESKKQEDKASEDTKKNTQCNSYQ